MLFLNASFNKTALVRYILYRHAWWWEVRKNSKKSKFCFFIVFGLIRDDGAKSYVQ
jgi:hypothetical protein